MRQPNDKTVDIRTTSKRVRILQSVRDDDAHHVETPRVNWLVQAFEL